MALEIYIIRIIEPGGYKRPYVVHARNKKEAVKNLSQRLGIRIIQYEFVIK